MNLGVGEGTSAGNRIDPRPVLIVTGLVQEARIAAGPGMTVICSSSDPQQLRALLTVFDPTTIRGVISFGVAGGLDPSLKSGDVVVATEVLAGDTRAAEQIARIDLDPASADAQIAYFETIAGLHDPRALRKAIGAHIAGGASGS